MESRLKLGKPDLDFNLDGGPDRKRRDPENWLKLSRAGYRLQRDPEKNKP